MSNSSATPWTVACRAPLSMGFPKKAYWSGLPFLSLRGSFWPKDQTRVPYIAGGLLHCRPIRNKLSHQGNPSIQESDTKYRLPRRLRWQRICLQCRRPGINPWVRKISWRREWQLTPIFLPGEVHGQRSLAGYSPQGCKESDTTKQSTHTYIQNM